MKPTWTTSKRVRAAAWAWFIACEVAIKAEAS